MLTAERLREVLNYDPETGVFAWIANTTLRNLIGKAAGCKDGSAAHKRIIIRIDSELHMAHRLAWLYMVGEFPPSWVDHINGDGFDNRWANLRLASVAQNMANSKTRVDNKSGLKGVQKQKNKSGTWMARITVGRKNIYIGTYATKQEAHQAYLVAAQKYHGEFACDGRRA